MGWGVVEEVECCSSYIILLVEETWIRRRMNLKRRHQVMAAMWGADSSSMARVGVYCVGEEQGEPAVASQGSGSVFQNICSQNP